MDNPILLDEEAIERIKKYAWLNLDKEDYDVIEHSLRRENRDDFEKPHIHLMRILRKPENFYLTCRLLLGVEIAPFQAVILQEMWYRPFPMLIGSRGMSKSFLLALYAVLRALFLQGRKIVITGAAFRQSKIVFNYIENFWNNAPVLRSLCPKDHLQGPKREPDKFTCYIGKSRITALPIGDGQKIRGERAHDILVDEMASVPLDILERVIFGFGVVSSDPIQEMKTRAAIKRMKDLGYDTTEMEDENKHIGNQTVISGTAYYQFNHFYAYWKRYKQIILSRGNLDKLQEIFGTDEIPKGFNWRNFSIIRIPIEMLPPGLMDETIVSRAKATIDKGTYEMEYAAIFTGDSNGFFKRKLIESCVCPVKTINGEEITFSASLFGRAGFDHVIAVDPASECDKFSIVVLEKNPDHRRVVYCWTTDRGEHKEKLKQGIIKEHDYYKYGARKIRNLLASFPCSKIAIDKLGGGIAVIEALGDPQNLLKNEVPIFEIIEEGVEKDSDNKKGLHIIEVIRFADAEWVSQANYGLKKDFEDKVLIFPFFDPIAVSLAGLEDEQNLRPEFDNLENCVLEIEDLKDELATIVITQTPGSNRERWDTPETKTAGAKKGRQRKDRYSALLMANMVARQEFRAPVKPELIVTGGFVKNKVERNIQQQEFKELYNAPAWFTKNITSPTTYGNAIRRRH